MGIIITDVGNLKGISLRCRLALVLCLSGATITAAWSGGAFGTGGFSVTVS